MNRRLGGAGTRGYGAGDERRDAPHRLEAPARHQRAAVRERADPRRAPRGVPANRHLRPVPADAGGRGRVRLRRRHARHVGDALGPAGRRHRGGVRRRGAGGARRGLRRLRRGVRPLRRHELRREPGTLRVGLGVADVRRKSQAETGLPAVRPGRGDVPGGPVRAGDLPAVRGGGPVRGLVRSLRGRVRADGPPRPRLHAERGDAGGAEHRPPVRGDRAAAGLPGGVRRLRRRAAGGGELPAGAVPAARRAAAGLGREPPGPLLRVRDPGAPRALLVRLVRRPDRGTRRPRRSGARRTATTSAGGGARRRGRTTATSCTTSSGGTSPTSTACSGRRCWRRPA